MVIALKIINAALILFALYMGIRQGLAMLTTKPEMTAMFLKWNFGKTGIMLLVRLQSWVLYSYCFLKLLSGAIL